MNKHRQFLTFACVGSIGFVIDMLSFGICHYLLGMELINSRVIAFYLAATTTWLGNRHFTFRAQATTHSARPTTWLSTWLLKWLPTWFVQWLGYLLIAMFALLPNLGAFYSVISFFRQSLLINYVALATGVIAGMLSNYLILKYLLFAEFSIARKFFNKAEAILNKQGSISYKANNKQPTTTQSNRQ